jgi:hypothetical protein
VDDASPDGTLEIAKQLQTVYGSDRIVSSLFELLPSIYVDSQTRFSNHDQENSALGQSKCFAVSHDTQSKAERHIFMV